MLSISCFCVNINMLYILYLIVCILVVIEIFREILAEFIKVFRCIFLVRESLLLNRFLNLIIIDYFEMIE